ncbi:MAG: hypothetical protein ABSF71_33955, partial [Terriglobia bacterium]
PVATRARRSELSPQVGWTGSQPDSESQLRRSDPWVSARGIAFIMDTFRSCLRRMYSEDLAIGKLVTC